MPPACEVDFVALRHCAIALLDCVETAIKIPFAHIVSLRAVGSELKSACLCPACLIRCVLFANVSANTGGRNFFSLVAHYKGLSVCHIYVSLMGIVWAKCRQMTNRSACLRAFKINFTKKQAF